MGFWYVSSTKKNLIQKKFFFLEKNDFEKFDFQKKSPFDGQNVEKIVKKSKISQIISKKESVRDATPCHLRYFSTTVIKIYASEVLI